MEAAEIEEADERRDDDLGPFILGELAPRRGRKRHRLPEAASPCSHGVVAGLLAAREEQGPIIDNTLGLQPLEAAFYVADEGVVAQHDRAKSGIDLRLVGKLGSSSPQR